MKTEINLCAEGNHKLIISKNRNECEDMCDNCYGKLQERIGYMSDRDKRMEVAEVAVFWANRLHHTNQKEADIRAYMACVMPEYPQHKVEKLIKTLN